jgi:hypothetical protein
MSHRDPASGSALQPRHFAYIVLALLPLSVASCDLLDATSIDINAAGSGGSAGSGAGSGGSGGVPMMGSGGSGGATGGSSGSAGAGATGGSSGSSGSAGAGGTGGSGGTGGTSEDPDSGPDGSVADSGGGSTSTFNCTSGDSACALCEVWTQLADCQPTATCPAEQSTALVGLGCDAQYAAYLDCYATQPVTSSNCAPGPSTRLADVRLGGTGTENSCQAQECALYDCLGALDPPGCN